MKIVIDIPKYIYEHAKEQSEDSYDEWDAMRAIANGTPLPEHHGRLIDADAFQKYCFNKNFDKRLSDGGLAIINMFLELQPTIIERSDSE